MMNHIDGSEERSKKIEEELHVMKEEYLVHEMTQEQMEDLRASMKETGGTGRRRQFGRIIKGIAACAAVLAAAFIILPNTTASIAYAMERMPIIGPLVSVVTFRDYQYESDRNMADISIPEIQIEEMAEESTGEATEAQTGEFTGEVTETQTGESVNISMDNISGDNASAAELDRTVEEINAEIKEITDELITEFEEGLRMEGNYQDIVVQSEVLVTTPSYFTLKLICYQGAGSGYQWNYYYTIDLNTGKRLTLSDIFVEGSDYLDIISDSIKEQMREQMAADENVYYWLEDEITEWNFVSITEDASFYINADNQVVIGFDEGEVAPMYMGTVEFEIPNEVLDGIRKE